MDCHTCVRSCLELIISTQYCKTIFYVFGTRISIVSHISSLYQSSCCISFFLSRSSQSRKWCIGSRKYTGLYNNCRIQRAVQSSSIGSGCQSSEWGGPSKRGSRRWSSRAEEWEIRGASRREHQHQGETGGERGSRGQQQPAHRFYLRQSESGRGWCPLRSAQAQSLGFDTPWHPRALAHAACWRRLTHAAPWEGAGVCGTTAAGNLCGLCSLPVQDSHRVTRAGTADWGWVHFLFIGWCGSFLWEVLQAPLSEWINLISRGQWSKHRIFYIQPLPMRD